MLLVLQLFINAFSLGSFYALIALGFSLIFGITRAFNLAHGEMILLGGYLAYALWKYLNVPFLLTLPFCMSALFFTAMLLHGLLRCVREPFEQNTMVITFGLAMVLQNGMLFFFSADYRLIQATVAPILSPFPGLPVTSKQVLLVVLSLLATGAVHTLLQKTFLGKALRATLQNSEAARLAGIHIRRMGLIAFSIGGLLIGLAGPLYAQTAYLHPAGGIEATLIAIIITIFAGVGGTRTILLGGWLLGFVESIAVLLLGASWRELVSALLLITLLLLRPELLPAGRNLLSK